MAAVIIVDLFLGWTLVGWVVALVFACRELPRTAPVWSPSTGLSGATRQAEGAYWKAYTAWEQTPAQLRGPQPQWSDFTISAIGARAPELSQNDAAYVRTIAGHPLPAGQPLAMPSGGMLSPAQMTAWLRRTPWARGRHLTGAP